MFKPEINTYLTISLPGEKLRAYVRKILTPDRIVLELLNVPLAKSHNYKEGDFVACMRKRGIFGESWEAIESRPSLESFVEKIDVKRNNTGTNRKKRTK